MPQLFLQLFAYWVSYVFMLVFLTAGLCCETNIQGRPHTEVSCCQLNWNSPSPGDRAGRQWKPAVIKADRVSGKLRNRSAMSVTKVLAWQWEKYKLSMAQTNANRPAHKHTDKWGKIRCPCKLEHVSEHTFVQFCTYLLETLLRLAPPLCMSDFAFDYLKLDLLREIHTVKNKVFYY